MKHALLMMAIIAVAAAGFADPEWKSGDCDKAGRHADSSCLEEIDGNHYLQNRFWTVNEASGDSAYTDESAYRFLCHTVRRRENEARTAADSLFYKLQQGKSGSANLETVKNFIRDGKEADLKAIASQLNVSGQSYDVRQTARNKEGGYYFEADKHHLFDKEFGLSDWDKYFLYVNTGSNGKPSLILEMCTYMNATTVNNGKPVGNFTDDCVKVDVINHEIVQHTKLPDSYQPPRKFGWKERFPRSTEKDWRELKRLNDKYRVYDCLVSQYNLRDPLSEMSPGTRVDTPPATGKPAAGKVQ